MGSFLCTITVLGFIALMYAMIIWILKRMNDEMYYPDDDEWDDVNTISTNSLRRKDGN